MADLVIFGIGKTAEVYAGLILTEGLHNVVGFAVDRPYWTTEAWMGRPVVPADELTRRFPPGQVGVAVAVGYTEANRARARKFAELGELGYARPAIVSRHAWLPADLAMPEGAFVMDRVSVQPGATLGANVAIWSGVAVGHHAQVGAHSWLAANATVGGNTVLGDRCLLGLGATVGHETRLGEGTFLGANACVTKPTPADSVYIDRDTPQFRLDHDSFRQLSSMP